MKNQANDTQCSQEDISKECWQQIIGYEVDDQRDEEYEREDMELLVSAFVLKEC